MKAKAFTPRRLKIALIAVPMLLGIVYYTLIASDRYTSESIVAVKSAVVSASPGGAISLGTGTGLLSWEDTLYLLDYVHSGTLARELNDRLKLRDHYEQPRADIFYRLWPGTSIEWFVKYYRSRVELEFSDINGLLTIRTQGFDPEMAEKLNRAILDSSERFVNDFSHRVAAEQMKFSQGEFEAASVKLQAAKAKLVAFQTANKILDPIAQTSAASALTAELQATVARLEADLKNKLAFMQPDAPQVVTLRDQIAANRAQLEAEKARTTNGQGGDRLGTLNVEYQNLQLASVIAEDAYKSSNAALEAARIEAARKLKSLVIVEAPTRAETAEYPRRIYNLLTLLALCAIVYSVVRLIVATIQEHQD
ncbi:capsular biosynthesis protein [Ideonella sp.]|uniref:capsular biosynthesis protein n=1 Tax=Ideonella sp. TaxID=1929293 RepID=UPI002B4A7885|nr:capsular biosynthesis protein [Ideonella sp.]HJV70923.1 capsular biosynthesis protein [Ideonella sp.]